MKRNVIISLALLALTFLLFVPAVRFDFIALDDPLYVRDNDRVLSGLSWENIRWSFATMKVANWHPLTWLSHMLDVQLFDADPGGHHLTSVVLHALNAALLFLALVKLTTKPWQSAIVAAIFAIHPLRLESVAWVSERKDVLCATFFFLSLICYAQFVKTRRRAWYAAVAGAFALGIMSKPMIVTLPCVLLLIDLWPLKRPVRWGLLVEKLPLFVMSIASCVVTFLAQHWGGATSVNHIPLPVRLGNAVWAYGRYVAKTFRPSNLSAFYPYYGSVTGTTFPWTNAAFSGVVLILVTLIAITMWKHQRAVLVGWLWFLGMLVPTIGIVQVGSQSLADRYTYLPQIGLLIAIVWGIDALLELQPSLRRAATYASCLVAIVLSISTAIQLRYWKNTFTLFDHALRVTDHNSTANLCLAIWFTHKDTDRAIRHYEEALRLDPNMAEVHSNVGGFLREMGQRDASLKHLTKAVELAPRLAEARNNLGNVLADLGRTDDAVQQFKNAIRIDPDRSEAWHNLGVTLAASGRVREAVRYFEGALKLRPGYLDARYAYALALVQTADVPAAKRQFEFVLQSRPDWTDAMQQFAWLLATSPNPSSRDPQSAVQLAEHANRLTSYEKPMLLDTLAAAYASAGRFDQAVATATRARDLATARGFSPLAERISYHLTYYQRNQPYIATTQPSTAPASQPTPSAL